MKINRQKSGITEINAILPPLIVAGWAIFQQFWGGGIENVKPETVGALASAFFVAWPTLMLQKRSKSHQEAVLAENSDLIGKLKKQGSKLADLSAQNVVEVGMKAGVSKLPGEVVLASDLEGHKDA